MKTIEQYALRIINVYQFYQINIFISFLCKDKWLEQSLLELLDKQEYWVRWITLRRHFVKAIIQHEHIASKKIGPIGELAVQLCLTEMISLYCEFCEDPIFESALKKVLWRFVVAQELDYNMFYSIIHFIRLCYVHWKDHTIKASNYSSWLSRQRKKHFQRVQLAVNSKEYELRIDIDLDKLVGSIDMYDFIDAHQSQYLLEFLLDIALGIRKDCKKIE